MVSTAIKVWKQMTYTYPEKTIAGLEDWKSRRTGVKKATIFIFASFGGALLVCGEYGLDSSDYTFGYLSSWKGDDGKMQEIGSVVQDVAGNIVKHNCAIVV